MRAKALGLLAVDGSKKERSLFYQFTVDVLKKQRNKKAKSYIETNAVKGISMEHQT